MSHGFNLAASALSLFALGHRRLKQDKPIHMKVRTKKWYKGPSDKMKGMPPRLRILKIENRVGEFSAMNVAKTMAARPLK